MKKILIPLLILILGGAIFMLLVKTKDQPERRQAPFLGPLVQTISAPTQTIQVIVDGQGTVRPAEQIDLVPQVSGIVTWKAEQLEAGGFFKRGDLLLRINPIDYELAVTRAEATVARARYQLDLVREESQAARKEWDMLQAQQGTQREAGALVLKLPQMKAAQADLQSAQAAFDEAHLRLSRTEIHAPFDGRVRSAGLEVGQYLNANQPVVQIYSIERAEIVVPVPDEDLAWFDIPNPLAADPTALVKPAAAVTNAAVERPLGAELTRNQAPNARIFTQYAGRLRQWQGKVVRTEAELDARSRMMRLVVEVDQPYAVRTADQAPLLVGMFVNVDIQGAELDDVRVLPRSALRQGNIVWVASREGILHLRSAQVVRTRGEDVLVRLELAPGERVIVSQLSGVTDGMKVRLSQEEV
jgi:RND family efflux transporter MFP subunit